MSDIVAKSVSNYINGLHTTIEVYNKRIEETTALADIVRQIDDALSELPEADMSGVTVYVSNSSILLKDTQIAITFILGYGEPKESRIPRVLTMRLGCRFTKSADQTYGTILTGEYKGVRLLVYGYLSPGCTFEVRKKTVEIDEVVVTCPE